jgi:hypothetical protein
MFEIETTEPRFTVCGCCDKPLTNVTGFAARDGEAWAIYKGCFGESHPEKGVYFGIGIDDVGDSPEWKGRVAFSFWLRVENDEYRTTVIDKGESPWNNSNVLGPMLDRSEALSHQLLQEVFHLVDHIVKEDPAIKELFETVH